MAIVNTVHKRAAKAAIARRVVAGDNPDLVALGVSEAAATLGLQLGNFSSQADMARYGKGVERNGEQVSNRRWASFPPEVASLSYRLERQAEAEIDAILQ